MHCEGHESNEQIASEFWVRGLCPVHRVMSSFCPFWKPSLRSRQTRHSSHRDTRGGLLLVLRFVGRGASHRRCLFSSDLHACQESVNRANIRIENATLQMTRGLGQRFLGHVSHVKIAMKASSVCEELHTDLRPRHLGQSADELGSSIGTIRHGFAVDHLTDVVPQSGLVALHSRSTYDSIEGRLNVVGLPLQGSCQFRPLSMTEGICDDCKGATTDVRHRADALCASWCWFPS